MKEFQKIAVGLLGLSNPEMFIPARQQSASAGDQEMPGAARVAQLFRAFKFVLAALVIGSRTVPLGDNRELVRDLTAQASLLYGADQHRG